MTVLADHQPVMLAETLRCLAISPDQWVLDATFGRGGHTAAILQLNARVIALDWDIEAIQYGEATFAEEVALGKLIFRRAGFSTLAEEVRSLKKSGTVSGISSILFDFGTSSDQLTSGNRGFSFNHEGPLDMRMDQRLGVQAMDLLVAVPEKQLADLFFEYGGEPEARQIAKAIKASPKPITTTTELSDVVIAVKKKHAGKLHPATKVFQALRIAVNSELDEIAFALPQALDALEPGGALVTIAFHEGEDRIVKNAFKSWQLSQKGQIETKKPMTPSEEEVVRNPRARSAKLRVFRKNI